MFAQLSRSSIWRVAGLVTKPSRYNRLQLSTRSPARPPPTSPRGAPPAPPPRPAGIIDANGNVLRSSSVQPPPRYGGASQAPASEAAPPSNERAKKELPTKLGSPVTEIVVDVTEANFMSAVLQCSVPVVLDCWAGWCKPCAVLTPRLEGVARAGRGALRLAKLNVDEQPALAAQLQVKSLPAVFGVVGGRVVASFNGAVGDEELRKFFDTLLAAGEQAGAVPTPTSRALDAASTAATMVDEGKVDEALRLCTPIASALDEMRASVEKQLRSAASAGEKGAAQALASATMAGPLWELDSARARVTAAMVRAYAARISAGAPPLRVQSEGDLDASDEKLMENDADAIKRLVHQLQSDLKSHCSHADVARAIAAAEVAGTSRAARDILAPLRAAVVARPDDQDARFALAEAELGAGQYAAAIENALGVLRSAGVSWRDGAPRQLLLKCFELLGPSHELTLSGRKALSKLLFR